MGDIKLVGVILALLYIEVYLYIRLIILFFGNIYCVWMDGRDIMKYINILVGKDYIMIHIIVPCMSKVSVYIIIFFANCIQSYTIWILDCGACAK